MNDQATDAQSTPGNPPNNSFFDDILEFIQLLWRTAPIIIIVTLAGTAISYLVLKQMTPVYEGQSTMIIIPVENSNLRNKVLAVEKLDADVHGTYVQLLSSAATRQAAFSLLADEYPLEALQAAEVLIRPVENSAVIRIDVTATNAQLTRDLSLALGQAAIQENPLGLVAEVYPIAFLDEAVVPDSPKAPDMAQGLLFGAAGSFLLGLALAFFIDTYRRRKWLKS